MNPETGVERQLTNLPDDFDIGDFDISPDGREVVLERCRSVLTLCCWTLPGNDGRGARKHA